MVAFLLECPINIVKLETVLESANVVKFFRNSSVYDSVVISVTEAQLTAKK